MRFLFINQVFPPDTQATSQYLGRWARDLVARGHEVAVLTSRHDYSDATRQFPARENWHGVNVIRIAHGTGDHRSKKGRAWEYLTFLIAASWRGLWLRRADVIVALTSPPLVSVTGAVLSLLWGAKFVYWVMDLNPDEAVELGWLKPEGKLTRIMEFASRWSLHRAARVIATDRYMKDRLVAKGIAAEKIEAIPLWSQGDVAYDAAGRERFRQKLGLGDRYVVMYAGNHTPCHPLDTLVDAVKLLRDEPGVHFCFVGGGMEWKRLRELAQAEQWPNATFLPYQPQEELPGILSAADAQVVVMGPRFVGIIHPCKVYNFLAARRPFLYIGPEASHVADLISEAGLGAVAAHFSHGEATALAEELRRRAQGDRTPPQWPEGKSLSAWGETAILDRMAFLTEKLSK